MLKALLKSIGRVFMWLFGPSHFLRIVDGRPRIVRHINSVDHRQSFMYPAILNGIRSLMYVSKMPKGNTWRVHKVRYVGKTKTPYLELIGKVDGEWCRILECTNNISISDSVLRESAFRELALFSNSAWLKLNVRCIEMIMKAAIIARWKQYPEHTLSTIVQTFQYEMPYSANGIPGLYAAINGTLVAYDAGEISFVEYVSDEYFDGLKVQEEYVIESEHDGEQLVYTISDCPVDWYVHGINHITGEITYATRCRVKGRAYKRIARPGSYVQAMEPEQRKAVLSEWEIPKTEVDELQRLAHMSAAELLDPEPIVLDVGDDEDVTKLADELYGPSSDTAAKFSQKYSSWDRMPKWADKKFHATEQREWTFLIEIDQFPLNCEVAYVIPGQYQQDGPIEAVVAFKPIGGGPTVICPFHCPVVEMRPVNNIHHCGDEYRTKDIVVLSRGWRYMFRDCWVPKNCMVSDERLVRNNPTGKPLIAFEYVYESGPMVGKVAVRRFVVPSQVARAGSNNQRKGKRQRGIGKRR